MHEVWVRCPACKAACRVFLIRLAAASRLLVNPHEHSVMPGVDGRSAVLLTEMRMVRNQYVGRIYGPQLASAALKSVLEVREPRERMSLRVGGLFFIVEGRSNLSEEIIRGFERYGEPILEWIPKIVWIKCLSGG
ncbi:MAG: hypothetical protein QXG35_05875, partial [Nitrososphaerota archaeon]